MKLNTKLLLLCSAAWVAGTVFWLGFVFILSHLHIGSPAGVIDAIVLVVICLFLMFIVCPSIDSKREI